MKCKTTKESQYAQIKVGDKLMCKPVLTLTTDGHVGPTFPSTRAVMASTFLEKNLDSYVYYIMYLEQI